MDKVLHKSSAHPAKARQGTVDLLRHLFILAVIWIHMPSVSRYSVEVNRFIEWISNYVGFAVPGFFLISGFYFSPKPTGVSDLRKTVGKLLSRLILPFLIFSLAYGLVNVVKGESPANQLLKILALNGTSAQLYFLPYLFGASLIFLLFVYSVTKFAPSKFPLLAVPAFLSIAGICLSILHPTDSLTGPGVANFYVYLASFSLGNLISTFISLDAGSLGRPAGLALLTFGLGLFDPRMFGIALPIVLLLVALFAGRKNVFLNKPFPGTGGIYLIHTPIVNYGLSSVLNRFGITNYENLFISFILTYVLCLALVRTTLRIAPKVRPLILE